MRSADFFYVASFLAREGVSMSRSNVIQWGGVAMMLSGVAFITRSRIPAASSVGDTIQLVAIALLAVGLVGLHALQKDQYGRIGRVFGLAGLSIVVIAASVSVVARIVKLLSGNEALVRITDIALPSLMLGLVLYGVATLLARVLPLWVGVAIIVALPLRIALVVIDPWGLTLFGLLWMVLGYVLWSRREAVVEQPSRVS